MEKQLRCKDCKWFTTMAYERKGGCYLRGGDQVNPGRFACKKFVYKDK